VLVYSEDQQLLKDTVARFVQGNSPVSALRRIRDAKVPLGYDADVWAEMDIQGWLGVLVSEEHGGIDYGFVGASIICEEMGRTLAASPFIVASLMATTALSRSGPNAPAARWLPAIASDRAVVALAVDEKPKHAPAEIMTHAVSKGDGWILTGAKSFVPEGFQANAYIVSARLPTKTGTALFLVETGDPGLTVERIPALDSRNAARLRLSEVAVAQDRLIALPDHGLEILDETLDAGRLGTAAEMSGISQEVFERTVDYVKQRKQFGRTIGSFQAIQHRLAHLHCEIETLKSAVLAAAQAAETDLATAKSLISAAKAKAESVSQLAAAESIQLHGGIGMTDELDLGLFMKRVRSASELWGDRHFHADRFAALRGY
jgi:alkylation response protein AidB-like acyl-CoA dehydrogenase